MAAEILTVTQECLLGLTVLWQWSVTNRRAKIWTQVLICFGRRLVMEGMDFCAGSSPKGIRDMAWLLKITSDARVFGLDS